jgi:hypothetical protein
VLARGAERHPTKGPSSTTHLGENTSRFLVFDLGIAVPRARDIVELEKRSASPPGEKRARGVSVQRKFRRVWQKQKKKLESAKPDVLAGRQTADESLPDVSGQVTRREKHQRLWGGERKKISHGIV